MGSQKLNNSQFEGYLFHGTNNADKILESGVVEPSGDYTVAGTSGVFTSTRPSGASLWGGDVVALRTTRPLKIHPDIESVNSTAQMRRQKQFSQDYFDGLGDEDLQELYGKHYGDSFPLTESSARNAVDVSEHLQKLGYDGHIDNMAINNSREKHVVVYNPEDLVVVKKLRRR